MTMRIPHPCPREFTAEWFDYLSDSRKNGISCEFGLFEKRDGSYVGNCGLASILYRHNQAEVVYFIDPEKWSRGFASEALGTVAEFAFGGLRMERLSGRCFADNAVSRRVMEKAGFVFEGIARHDIFKNGKYMDVCQLGMLRSDWEKKKHAAGSYYGEHAQSRMHE
jgi:ribosomal-protein-alanine N-acetyltransferase